jgi:CheY-like chemotaxis protein
MPARILIVEDDQIIAADLRLKVERLGHAVVGIASAGEEAIGLAEKFKPEIVLMDIQLEEAMSGTEAARIIQERTGAAIVFVTAFLGAAFRDESGRMPDRRIYLGKPFSQVQLEQALDTALRNRS